MYKCHEELVKDWGIEAFNQITASFCHVLKLLSDQKIKSHEYGKLSYEAIIRKGRCVQRSLFLKLKDLIKTLEQFINRGPGPRVDILRVNHLSDVSPGLTSYCKLHHIVKLD